MNESISIIIPVYKTPYPAVHRCLKSIDEQEDVFIEVILVFDGAPDYAISQLISDFSDLRICCQKVDHAGVSHARNVGLSLATSRYVMFVDADDVLPPHAVHTLWKTMGDTQLAVGAFYKVQGKTRELVESSGLSQQNDDNSMVSEFQKGVLLPDTGNGLLWNKMYSLPCISNNDLRFNEALSIAEDSDFVYRYLSFVDRIAVTDDPVYEYIRSSASAVTSFDEDYERKVLLSMETMKKNQSQTLRVDGSYIATYYTFHVLLILVHYIFNPSNGWNDKEKRKAYKDLWNKTNLYIYESRKDAFSAAKKIATWCFLHRLFTLNRVIAWIRNRQIG